MFSKRLQFDLRPNQLARLISSKKKSGISLCDLTVSNPTRSGFSYPDSLIKEAFSVDRIKDYSPDPRGLIEAREAVSLYYRERGSLVSPDEILITASTSEAYSFLFRLLADPGEEIMIPQPGYPLFDFLIRLESLVPLPLPIRYSEGWWYDFRKERLGEGVRGVVVISPGNPTGNYIKSEEWAELVAGCVRTGSALICDEVFHDYPLAPGFPEVNMAEESDAVTFLLNGFSKIAGMPQVKMGWIVLRGPEKPKREAMRKLELISDTYLSATMSVQRAAGDLFKIAREIREQIKNRIRRNLDMLGETARSSALDCLAAEGGWSAVLRLPGTRTGEEWAIHLLERAGVVTHPGEFYSLEGGPYLVVSLLPEEELFTEGIKAIIKEL